MYWSAVVACTLRSFSILGVIYKVRRFYQRRAAKKKAEGYGASGVRQVVPADDGPVAVAEHA
jgi:hypothetical protein